MSLVSLLTDESCCVAARFPVTHILATDQSEASVGWPLTNERPGLVTIFTVVVAITDTRSTWCQASHCPPGHILATDQSEASVGGLLTNERPWCQASHCPPGHGDNCYHLRAASWDFLQNEKSTCYWWIKINGRQQSPPAAWLLHQLRNTSFIRFLDVIFYRCHTMS